MTIAVVGHTAKVQTPDNGSNTTSSGFNSTGGPHLVLGLSYYGTLHGNFTSFTDNYGNTFTPLTAHSDVNNDGAQLFYKENATVGSGHTITLTVGGTLAASFYAAAFSGVASSSSFDTETGNHVGSGNSLHTGSLTAANAGSLYVTQFGANYGSSGTQSIDSSFTIIDTLDYVGGQGAGGALAWKESSAAENPLWAIGNANGGSLSAAIAIFAPGGGGPPPPAANSNATLMMMGVG